MTHMPTLVMDPPPAEFEALIERRRRLGLDHHDEMWEGVYHMAPAPNIPHSLTGQELSMLLGAAARKNGLRVSLEFNLGVQEDHCARSRKTPHFCSRKFPSLFRPYCVAEP